MAAKTSSTSSSKAARGAWFGLAIVVLINVIFGLSPAFWLDGRESDINDLIELERRIERFPDRDAVKVLLVGNSHMYTGLRPPDLARHLQLPPYGVFSLAIPGCNPQEARLLIERHAARFPHARLVISNVDISMMNWFHGPRMRYMTRHSLTERWRMAEAEQRFEDRLGLMIGLAFPLFDFKESLRRRVLGDPGPADKRPRERYRKIAAMDYPWGVPINFDHPGIFGPGDRAILQGRMELLQRAKMITAFPWRIEHHAADLARLYAEVRARGLSMVFVELPVSGGLSAALEVKSRAVMASYRRALDAFVTDHEVSLLPMPELRSFEHYYDGDHLSADGARQVAAALGTNPTLRKLVAR